LEPKIESEKQFEEKQDSLKGAKILIVDDEDMVRMLISDTLAENGYDVWEAKSAEDAINKVKETLFDLLITDIKMPGMGGLELLRYVKMSYPSIEVIIITGYHDPECEEYSMAHGAADFIMKSSHFEKLLTSVDRALKNRV
jgi:DNA-binding NtrC family response regulator